MNSSPEKNRGCRRKSCLVLTLVPLLLIVVLFCLFRSSHTLPDRFVLNLQLSGDLSEIQGESSTLPFLSSREPLSLQDLLFILDHAAADERVKELLLEIGGLHASPAKISELRSSIEKVRSRGKKVTAFLSSPEDSDYLLASACDAIVMERGGYLLLDGLKAETLFYTTPLGKIGIRFQAAQWKQYKSGIEPFTRTGASREYFEQIGGLLDEVYDDYLGYASRRRGISRDSLSGIIDRIALISDSRAKTLGLVDSAASSWELKRALNRKITGKEPTGENDALVSGGEYRSAVDWPMKGAGDERIALITLSGPIVRTAGESALGMGEGVDVESLRHSLDAALDDKKVKALVLRIDSPGGDALASAEILQMLDSAAVKKPLVVSMSGVAASGGYMAALAGKTVFASPLTITGSIGVYALKPEISALVAKTGLGRDVVTRGRLADANSPFKPLDKEAYRKFVAASGEIYDDFIGKVARSRRMPLTAVDSVAGGRVWSGTRALKAGLVDRTGGLFDAIHAARLLAKMDMSKNPRIILYPEQKSWIEMLVQGNRAGLPGMIGAAFKKQLMQEFLPVRHLSSIAAFYDRLMLSGRVHMMAMMPSEIIIE
ncbi:signal peptide peptidase SppA [Chlorobium sp. KB01]|uniref:signal peptide peptidase SppA n=1 Tax=Chlorobium sp. KB01 TaxID=1917528 RepID=UPI0009782028|nr:signal peptide peptidase SppA [Chlorobium sp. KB01]